jgi:hypothetical protein
MTISVRTTGTGRFRGHETNVSTYQYTEGAMPHDVFDQSGEVGELSFEVDSENTSDSLLLYRDRVELSDDFYGSVTGFINGVNYSDGFLQITGSNRLSLVNTEVVLPAAVSTIAQYVRVILEAASITSDIVVDPLVSNEFIIAPAYEGNLWVLLKQFAAFHQLDVSLINNTVNVRNMRGREVSVQSVVSENLNLSEQTFSQKFNVAYYNYERLTDVLAFPKGGWTPDVQVYSVEANETVVFDIPVDAFLDSVKQPIVQDFVARDYSGPNSVYSVTANDGLPISAAFWSAFDGAMSFELTDLGRNIRVTLRGMDLEELSPFSISVSDGATEYSTLRIVGSGTFFNRQTVTIPTGLTAEDTPQEFGQEIDNVFINTFEEAVNAGVRARRNYCLPTQKFDTSGRSFQGSTFTRFEYLTFDDDAFGFWDFNIYALLGPEGGLVFFPSFDEYDLGLPSPFAFDDFDVSFQSATFDDFDASQAEVVGQAFGTVAGSRLKFGDAYYRVKFSRVSESEASLEADYDTLFSDFNAFSQ